MPFQFNPSAVPFNPSAPAERQVNRHACGTNTTSDLAASHGRETGHHDPGVSSTVGSAPEPNDQQQWPSSDTEAGAHATQDNKAAAHDSVARRKPAVSRRKSLLTAQLAGLDVDHAAEVRASMHASHSRACSIALLRSTRRWRQHDKERVVLTCRHHRRLTAPLWTPRPALNRHVRQRHCQHRSSCSRRCHAATLQLQCKCHLPCAFHGAWAAALTCSSHRQALHKMARQAQAAGGFQWTTHAWTLL